jgi:hypothetical protein
VRLFPYESGRLRWGLWKGVVGSESWIGQTKIRTWVLASAGLETNVYFESCYCGSPKLLGIATCIIFLKASVYFPLYLIAPETLGLEASSRLGRVVLVALINRIMLLVLRLFVRAHTVFDVTRSGRTSTR